MNLYIHICIYYIICKYIYIYIYMYMSCVCVCSFVCVVTIFYQCFQFCPVQIDSQWLSTMMVSLFPIACLRCLRCRRTTKFGTSAWGPGCRRQSRMWGWASMASILSPWLFDHHEKKHELMIFTSWTHDIPLIFTWYSHEIPMDKDSLWIFSGWWEPAQQKPPPRTRRATCHVAMPRGAVPKRDGCDWGWRPSWNRHWSSDVWDSLRFDEIGISSLWSAPRNPNID